MEHDNEQYADNAGNHLLQQQYNQNYNPSDAFSSHAFGHSDASWNVNATAFPQTTKLSHVSYQNGDWPVQQDAPPQRDTFSHSPLPGGSVYNGHGNYNGYDSATFSYAQPQQQYDPSLMPTQNSAFRQVQPVSQHGHDSRTIEPHALDNLQQRAQAQPTTLPTVPAAAQFAALHQAVPKGTVKGDSTIIDSEKLVKVTKSEKLAAFLFIGKEPITWDLNRSALPAYVPRASKNDLKRAAGNDGQLLAKINSRSFKKQRIAKARSSRPMKSAGDVARSRNDLSSESDYSSDYSSDEDDEVSPLPSKRPEMPKEAMEYDTIQALWKSRKANVTAADIRKGLVDFWDLVKTVRDRWKLDGAAVTAAEEKGAKGELPMLRQRVKDSRDMIEVAFKAALHHGNRTIVSNFSENTPLLFLCYQFLLDRFKSDDINGPLAKTLLEVLSLATSITAEKLEKTFLGKVLPRFIKLGDAKTQHLARTVANKATPGKVEPAKVEKPTDKAAALAGNKRAAESDVGAPPKRPATASASAAASKAVPAGVKKVVPNGTAAKVTPADIVKPVQKASSLKSGLFAGLQSATKKPGTSIKTGTPAAAVVAKPAAVPVKPQPATQPAAAASKPAFSFADTMRSLTQPKEDKPKPKTLEKEITNETPEQKARRLRREARGPLRVHWKSADELVAIREFTHDPEEETGHDSSQVRDVADLQGEGRMFKQQHNKMELDDDEDEVDDVLRDWYEPKEVDFSDVPDEERQRNFYPYGGAQQKADSAENIERKKYEDSTLSVFYSHADDIPLTPRDPEEPISGEQIELKQFGDLGQQYIDRGAKLRASRQPAPAPGPIDFSALRNIMGMQPNAFAATAHAPPPPPTGVPDIGAIIAQLQQNKPQAPAQPAFMPQFAGLFPQQPVAAAPPAAGTPDIAAILAQINGGQSVAPPPVQAPALPFAMPPPPGMADPGFLAFLAQRAAQTQPPAPSGGMYENADRKRMRDA